MRKPVFTPILLALLIAGLCLAGLSGCGGKDDPVPDTDPAPSVPTPDPAPSDPEPEVPGVPADAPLTEEKLRYFNEEFFNGAYLNIRNQFLTSVYETPADIDLFELFYCGTGWDEAMPDEEWAAFEAADGFVETDVTKISAANADAVLLEYTGLTLEETNKVGLENFIYLPEYDAYYNAHGDTNYLNEVAFSSGEWKDGLIRLYYSDEYGGGAQKCAVLRETADGKYQFVSNGFLDEPVS